MMHKFKDIQGKNVTLVERRRAFMFHCDEATRVNEFNLQLTGTAKGLPPATVKPWQFVFGGTSWGTDLQVTPEGDGFVVKAETVITAPDFWES